MGFSCGACFPGEEGHATWSAGDVLLLASPGAGGFTLVVASFLASGRAARDPGLHVESSVSMCVPFSDSSLLSKGPPLSQWHTFDAY